MGWEKTCLKMCAFLLATLYAKVRSPCWCNVQRSAAACSTVQLSSNKTQNSDSAALPGPQWSTTAVPDMVNIALVNLSSI